MSSCTKYTYFWRYFHKVELKIPQFLKNLQFSHFTPFRLQIPKFLKNQKNPILASYSFILPFFGVLFGTKMMKRRVLVRVKNRLIFYFCIFDHCIFSDIFDSFVLVTSETIVTDVCVTRGLSHLTVHRQHLHSVLVTGHDIHIPPSVGFPLVTTSTACKVRLVLVQQQLYLGRLGVKTSFVGKASVRCFLRSVRDRLAPS